MGPVLEAHVSIRVALRNLKKSLLIFVSRPLQIIDVFDNSTKRPFRIPRVR